MGTCKHTSWKRPSQLRFSVEVAALKTHPLWLLRRGGGVQIAEGMMKARAHFSSVCQLAWELGDLHAVLWKGNQAKS